MRQPTFGPSRRRARQQRLLRTGIGVVVLVAVAAAIANLVGGDGGEPTDGGSEPNAVKVAFTGRYRGDGEERPARATVTREGQTIVTMLNDWYQRGFVDPALFGDGTFPEIAAMFDPAARTQFTADINSLTIGEARTEVARVEPSKATATITVYFEGGKRPRLAVADVRFAAVGTMKTPGAFPIEIDQKATLHLRRTSKGWIVVWYTSDQTQESILPAPSPSGSPS